MKIKIHGKHAQANTNYYPFYGIFFANSIYRDKVDQRKNHIVLPGHKSSKVYVVWKSHKGVTSDEVNNTPKHKEYDNQIDWGTLKNLSIFPPSLEKPPDNQRDQKEVCHVVAARECGNLFHDHYDRDDRDEIQEADFDPEQRREHDRERHQIKYKRGVECQHKWRLTLGELYPFSKRIVIE
jgi:hypothetical protein